MWVLFANKEGYNPLFPTDSTLVRLLFSLEKDAIASTQTLKGVRAAIFTLGGLGCEKPVAGPLTFQFRAGRSKLILSNPDTMKSGIPRKCWFRYKIETF